MVGFRFGECRESFLCNLPTMPIGQKNSAPFSSLSGSCNAVNTYYRLCRLSALLTNGQENLVSGNALIIALQLSLDL